MNILYDAVRQRHGVEAAYALLREELKLHPSLLGLEKLLEARLLDAPEDRRPDVELVKNLVHQRTRALAMYRCTRCGFKARNFHWHCPACHGWDTTPPRRTEETGVPL
jgi:lipopolysaccharide biosynthesis regulator YciM